MSKIKLPDKTYNRIQLLVRIILPVFASVYYIVESLRGIHQTIEVVGSCLVLIMVLGILLSVSDKNSNYSFDGDMIVERNEGKTLASLALETDPNDLFEKERVIFKVLKKESHI